MPEPSFRISNLPEVTNGDTATYTRGFRRIALHQIAVQIGAGNIGRGFIAQLFHESDLQVHFIDADSALVDALNNAGEYAIEIAVEPAVADIQVSRVHAHLANDAPAVAGALSQAVVASISAGAKAQPAIARMLATGLTKRLHADAPPLNILVCENPPGEAHAFRDAVRSQLEPALQSAFDAQIAFVDTVIGRMVPVLSDAARERDPLRVRVEPYCELPVDADAVLGELPKIAHLHAESPFDFWIERKLFMHNAAHAATAYVGYLRGHEYIHQAIADVVVRNVVDDVLRETAAALAQKYGYDAAALQSHADDLVRRFANPALRDTVERVARDPVRKLSKGERFIRAADCCLAQGVEPRGLAVAAAAAIRYDQGSDSGAMSVQELLRDKGWDAVLHEVCGLPSDSPFAALVKESDPAMASGKSILL